MSLRQPFDVLAPHYWWLEKFTFGPMLQRCRTAHLSELGSCRNALILGDGDGRFLESFLAIYPQIRIDCLDISLQMIKRAKKRLKKYQHRTHKLANNRPNADVNFYQGDLRYFELPRSDYDLIITNFFLDCFPAGELPGIIAKLARHTAKNALWVVGDFAIPELKTPSGSFLQEFWIQQAIPLLLKSMYLFFRLTTSLRASRLIDPAYELDANGFRLIKESRFLGGFLSARLWLKEYRSA